MITKLLIAGVEVKIVKDIPVSVNYAIADVRDLSKRGGTLTKTVNLLGTQEVNIIFENVFDVNIELSTFNPNVKLEAIYYINEREQFKGDLQLIKVIENPNGSIEYQCQIIGREGSLFVAIGDKFLTDINFSNLDHTFNKTEQKNSWATSYRLSGVATPFAYGSGYVYPMIKYGYAASDSIFDVNHFKPAIFVKEYVDRIFTAAGFTYTSTFLTSALFKRLVIPCNRDKIELTSAAINASQYYIGKIAIAPAPFASGNTLANSAILTDTSVAPNYDLETAPYFDTSAQYNTGTYIGTVANAGTYNIVAYAQHDISVNAAAYPGGNCTSASGSAVNIQIEINTGSGWVLVAGITNTSPVTNQAYGVIKSFTANCQSGNIFLPAGCQIRVKTKTANITYSLFDSLNAPVANGTAWTMNLGQPNGTTKNSHYLLRVDTQVYDGNALAMNNTIPLNIKQKDFILSIFQMFNLFVEKDKTNEKNLIIEPRDTFYTATVDDWTNKVDYNKNFEVLPMGELDARNYIWKYKDDKDYYNDLYQKQFTDNYGLKRKQITNDFIKAEKKTELVFSPTPIISNSTNNIICPHIYAKDGVNLKTVSHNIRILYYNGLQNSGNAWSYTSTPAGTTSETQYPYIGHIDDPLTPTIDLNFDFPKQVYYTYPLAYYSLNNLYNAYYSKFINEITDKDSKIVTCYVTLSELDIENFTFRNKIFIMHPVHGGTYYIVNKIIDYNPLEQESTKVELLKLKNYAAYVPTTIPIDASNDPASTARIGYNPETNAYANNNTGNTVALGSSNRVMGIGNYASGERNFIDESSLRVSLIDCVGCSAVGVTNFTGIGLSNRVITSADNNTTINETTTGNVKIKNATKTSSFNIDREVNIYYIDCTAGNIIATFNFVNDLNRTITFIRIDATANTFSIDEISGIATLQGTGVPVNLGMVQWDSLPINNNGTDFFIT